MMSDTSGRDASRVYWYGTRFAGGLALVLLIGALAGCQTFRARQPKLVDAGLTPSDLKPGDAAVLTVHVVDRHELVRKVEGVIREDPVVKFKLHDDGVAPDEKAHDNIWSLAVDVPFQAPPGEFILDLTAYGADGRPIHVRKGGNVTQLGVSIPVSIHYPPPAPSK